MAAARKRFPPRLEMRPMARHRRIALIKGTGSRDRAGTAESRSSFEDHVEWRLRSAPDIAEAAGSDDLTQFRLAGLCTEGCTNFLRQRSGHAPHRRAGIVEPAYRVQIVFQLVAGHRL